MHTHQLLVEDVLSFSKNLLSLSSSRLFSFSLSSDVFSKSDHTSNSSLLLKSNQLLGKVVHGSRHNIRLQSFRDSIKYSLLVSFNESSLLLEIGGCFPLFSGSQFGNEIKSLFFTFEHHVLCGSSSKETLKKNDGSTFLIVSLKLLIVLPLLTEVVENWSVGPHLDVVQQILAFIVSVLAGPSLNLNVNRGLSLLKLSDVAYVSSGKSLLELLVDSVYHNLALEVLAGQGSAKFFDSDVRGESFRLHFVLVCLLV